MTSSSVSCGIFISMVTEPLNHPYEIHFKSRYNSDNIMPGRKRKIPADFEPLGWVSSRDDEVQHHELHQHQHQHVPQPQPQDQPRQVESVVPQSHEVNQPKKRNSGMMFMRSRTMTDKIFRGMT